MKYVLMIIVGLMLIAAPAVNAAEELIVKADSVEFKTDKNGKEYATLRFSKTTTTGRLTYNEQVLAIIPAWQTDALKVAKTIKPGQSVVMAGGWNSYNGNDSFKVKALSLDAGTAAAKR